MRQQGRGGAGGEQRREAEAEQAGWLAWHGMEFRQGPERPLSGANISKASEAKQSKWGQMGANGCHLDN